MMATKTVKSHFKIAGPMVRVGRSKKSMSRAKLAKAIGATKSEVQAWEECRAAIPDKFTPILVGIFGINNMYGTCSCGYKAVECMPVSVYPIGAEGPDENYIWLCSLCLEKEREQSTIK